MKLKQQVTSLIPSKRLRELGVKQESLFYWRLGYSTSESFDKGVSLGKKGIFRDYELTYCPHPRYTTADVKWNEVDLRHLNETEVSAFTVAELGEMDFYKKFECRTFFVNAADDKRWMCASNTIRIVKDAIQYADTEADVRAKMLIYLLENKLITL